MDILWQAVYTSILETPEENLMNPVAWRLYELHDDGSSSPPDGTPIFYQSWSVAPDDDVPQGTLQLLQNAVLPPSGPLSSAEDQIPHSRGNLPDPPRDPLSPSFLVHRYQRLSLKLTNEDLCLAEPLPLSGQSNINICTSPDVFKFTPVSTSSTGSQTYFTFADFEKGVPLSADTPTFPLSGKLAQSLSTKSSQSSPFTKLANSPGLRSTHETRRLAQPSAARKLSLATPPMVLDTPRLSPTTPTDVLSALAEMNADFPGTPLSEISTPPSCTELERSTSSSSFAEIDWQETKLREVFRRRAYLGAAEKARLARKLGITVENVQRWFKNARRRRSREHERRLSGHSDPCKMKLASL